MHQMRNIQTKRFNIDDLYKKHKGKIDAQAYELKFCLENNYNDSMKCISPWMRKMWKNGQKDWFDNFI